MNAFIKQFPPVETVLKMEYRLGLFRNDKKFRLEVIYGHAGYLSGADLGGHVVAWAAYHMFSKDPEGTFQAWRKHLNRQPWSVIVALPAT